MDFVAVERSHKDRLRSTLDIGVDWISSCKIGAAGYILLAAKKSLFLVDCEMRIY
jgi:hypothetical protein